MKNTILIMLVTIFITGTIVTGCQSSTKKIENAREKLKDAEVDVVEATHNLNLALQDSIQQFKKESEDKISAIEKSIAEFKASIANETKENKAIYQKKLIVLEQKNSELRKKLEDYKDEGQDKWTSFKHEFNHDMDELSKAFKDLTVNNTR